MGAELETSLFPSGQRHMGRSVALVARFPRSGYSGGRFHALALAVSLASQGLSVTVVTDFVPSFHVELSRHPSYSKIRWSLINARKLSGDFDESPDWVFYIPDHTIDSWVPAVAYDLMIRYQSRLAILDFETPDWFRLESGTRKSPKFWDGPKFLSPHADLVLSSTQIGSHFAQEFYSLVKDKNAFRYAHPPLNTPLIDEVERPLEKNGFFFPTRVASGYHKGGSDILRLVSRDFRGQVFRVLLDDTPDGQSLADKLIERAEKHEIDLEVYKSISDREKFALMATSRAVVLLSSFEGYGLSAAEAIHLKLPLIAYDLSVFREILPEDVALVEKGNIVEVRSRMLDLLSEGINLTPDYETGRSPVTIEGYGSRVVDLMAEAESLPKARVLEFLEPSPLRPTNSRNNARHANLIGALTQIAEMLRAPAVIRDFVKKLLRVG